LGKFTLYAQEQMVAQCIYLLEDIICSKTHLDGITHEQTIICRQFYAVHMAESCSMKNESQEKML